MLLVYLAGPLGYERVKPWKLEANKCVFEAISLALWGRGFVPIVPHRISDGIEHLFSDNEWIERMKVIIRKCDAVLLLPGWEGSPGAKEEKEFADSCSIPVYIWPELPDNS